MFDDRSTNEAPWATIDFSREGNSSQYRGEGWSGQEPEHIWAIGERSELTMEPVPDQGSLRVKLEVMPFVWRPVVSSQLLTVFVNGTEVAEFEISGRTTVDFDIPATAFEGHDRLLIAFNHPNAARPSDMKPGHSDTRPLSVAFYKVTFFPAEAPSRHVPDTAMAPLSAQPDSVSPKGTVLAVEELRAAERPSSIRGDQATTTAGRQTGGLFGKVSSWLLPRGR